MTTQILPGGHYLSVIDLYRYYHLGVLFFLYVSSSTTRYLSPILSPAQVPFPARARERKKEGRGRSQSRLYVVRIHPEELEVYLTNQRLSFSNNKKGG